MAFRLISIGVTPPPWAAGGARLNIIQGAVFDANLTVFQSQSTYNTGLDDTDGDFYLMFEFLDGAGALVGQPVVHGPYDPAVVGSAPD